MRLDSRLLKNFLNRKLENDKFNEFIICNFNSSNERFVIDGLSIII